MSADADRCDFAVGTSKNQLGAERPIDARITPLPIAISRLDSGGTSEKVEGFIPRGQAVALKSDSHAQEGQVSTGNEGGFGSRGD